MVNDEIDNKIIKNVRSRIAVSNLEKEYSMKRYLKRKVISLSLALIVIFAGGFITVDAATNGQLMETIKEKMNITSTKDVSGEKYFEYTSEDEEEFVRIYDPAETLNEEDAEEIINQMINNPDNMNVIWKSEGQIKLEQ